MASGRRQGHVRDLFSREGLVRGQQGRISGQRTNMSQGRASEMSTACSLCLMRRLLTTVKVSGAK